MACKRLVQSIEGWNFACQPAQSLDLRRYFTRGAKVMPLVSCRALSGSCWDGAP